MDKESKRSVIQGCIESYYETTFFAFAQQNTKSFDPPTKSYSYYLSMQHHCGGVVMYLSVSGIICRCSFVKASNRDIADAANDAY